MVFIEIEKTVNCNTNLDFISGSNVNIENTDSIYNAQEKHEFKRSGLSVSIGGEAIDIVNSAVSHIERADDVEDKRLAALHGYKAVEDVTKTVDKNKQLIEKGFAESQWDKLEKAVQDPAHNLSLNVSIGSTKSKSESSSTTVVANGSNVKAEGDVKIISTEKDINIKGSNVEGKDVTLDAKENLNITASETTNKLEQDSKSSSASVGVGFDIATGQVSSVTISGSKSKGEVDANSTSYNESTVKADKNLGFTSGKDTNIKGGKLSGEKVTGNVGGDLNIESKQDKNSYEEKNSSAGFGIGIDLSGQNKKDSQDNLDKKDKVNNANKTGIFGSAGKSDVDSKYESVTDQSGIYAGKEGFDINVGENTDLKGGIISSEAEKDKNKISTGTLTYEDIKNKAEYEAGSIGVNVDTSKDAEKKDAGVTPNIGVGAKDDAESTTKATVSEGEIEIRDKENQKQDLKNLNRDTKNSLNKLGEVFDKTKIEERQELAGLFGEVAFNQIHYMKGTKEQKALYHALVGGIMGKLTSGDFLAGASATAINKLVIGEIEKIAGKDPAMMQWLSAALGGVISEVVSKNAEAGAGAASSATKNNDLDQELSTEFGHIPKTEKEVMEGEEQNLDNKYEITMEDLSNAIFGNATSTVGNESMKSVLSKEFPDYIRIESYPGSNSAFRIYYPSGGKLVSSVLKEVPVFSGGSLLIKLNTDYGDGKDVNWEKELVKFSVSEVTGYTAGKIIAGPTGVVVGVIAGGVIETSVDKLWSRIESFKNGGVPLDR